MLSYIYNIRNNNNNNNYIKPHLMFISSYLHILISSYPHILLVSSYPRILISSPHPHILRSSYPHYISQLVGNALHARTISLGSVKIISNAIARSIDLRQNIVPRKSAQQRRHVDAKQQVRNASARNKRKRINKARCNRLCSFVNHPFTQLMHRGGNTRSDMSEIAGEQKH